MKAFLLASTSPHARAIGTRGALFAARKDASEAERRHASRVLTRWLLTGPIGRVIYHRLQFELGQCEARS